jgi:hypothetical protein
MVNRADESDSVDMERPPEAAPSLRAREIDGVTISVCRQARCVQMRAAFTRTREALVVERQTGGATQHVRGFLHAPRA